MADYVPIPFAEWKRANPELCEEWPCGECDGCGWRIHANEIGDPPPGFEEHPELRDACPYCDGGTVSEAGSNYLDRLHADREKWDAAMALKRTY